VLLFPMWTCVQIQLRRLLSGRRRSVLQPRAPLSGRAAVV